MLRRSERHPTMSGCARHEDRTTACGRIHAQSTFNEEISIHSFGTQRRYWIAAAPTQSRAENPTGQSNTSTLLGSPLTGISHGVLYPITRYILDPMGCRMGTPSHGKLHGKSHGTTHDSIGYPKVYPTIPLDIPPWVMPWIFRRYMSWEKRPYVGIPTHVPIGVSRGVSQ